MRRKLVAGNWKMNGSRAVNASLLAEVTAGAIGLGCEIAVCVPAPYLAQAESVLSGSTVAWGGQDVSQHVAGAYTGEVSADMLHDFSARYVIVGHSERRAYFAEDDALVAAKTVRALGAGLVPIVCVGETLAQREAGQTDAVVSSQIDVVLDAIAVGQAADIVIAYEPVWAIGTGKTATPEMAQEVHAMLRSRVAVRNPAAAIKVQILYGGSMKPDNAGDLMAMADIDGGLIGGASLKSGDFLAIAVAACAR